MNKTCRSPLRFKYFVLLLLMGFLSIWFYNQYTHVQNSPKRITISPIAKGTRVFSDQELLQLKRIVFESLAGKHRIAALHNRKKIACGSHGKMVACTASPPLTSAEINNRRIDYNVDREFTFHSQYTEDQSATYLKPSIPKIIHLMWTNETIPTEFVGNVKSFVKHHRQWSIFFWTYSLARSFLVDKYRHLVKVFDNYSANVSRSDMFRLVLMYHYGGAYFDLDTRCLKPLDAIAEKENCLFSPEPIEHSVLILKRKSLLNSCVLICRPKHKFYEYVLKQLEVSSKTTNIMNAAGPTFVTSAVYNFIAEHRKLNVTVNDSIHIVSNELFLDRVKFSLYNTLEKICSNRSTTWTPTVCKHWKDRGGINRTFSTKSYTDHLYFGTYNDDVKIHFSSENYYTNVIPGVKVYQSNVLNNN